MNEAWEKGYHAPDWAECPYSTEPNITNWKLGVAKRESDESQYKMKIRRDELCPGNGDCGECEFIAECGIGQAREGKLKKEET